MPFYLSLSLNDWDHQRGKAHSAARPAIHHLSDPAIRAFN
jgi:hypothetical protein